MNLNFKTHIDGKPTYFPDKIWDGILDKVPESECVETGFEYMEYLESYRKKFGVEWDRLYKPDGDLEIISPKITTIMADKRWRSGMDIHFTVFGRTPNRFQFAPVIKCKSTQDFSIKWLWEFNDSNCYRRPDSVWTAVVLIDGRKQLHRDVIPVLAKNDGFESTDDFFKFFNKDFTGKIIHWTELKY